MNHEDVFYPAVLLFCLIPVNQSVASQGRGGGAGCPQSDGSVITLLECGAAPGRSVLPNPPPGPPLAIDGPSERPQGLDELISYIKAFPYLDDDVKARLLESIEPSFYRKYFSVTNAPGLTQTITNRIKNQFEETTGLKSNRLILYGVTDTNATLSHSSHKANITYLLPAFWKLKTMEEKMTALIHESYWVYNHWATYSSVVETEVAFESAMQKPNDTQRAIQFVGRVTTLKTASPKYMQLLLKSDLETGALKGFVNDQDEITNYQLYGAEAINCYRSVYGKYNSSGYHSPFDRDLSEWSDSLEICRTQFLNYRDTLLRQFPKSNFLGKTAAVQGTADHMQMSLGGKNYYPLLEKTISPLFEMVGILTGNIDCTYDEANHNCYVFHGDGEFGWTINATFTGDQRYDIRPTDQVIKLKLSTDPKDGGPMHVMTANKP